MKGELHCTANEQARQHPTARRPQRSEVHSKHTTPCTLPDSVHEVTLEKVTLALRSQVKTAIVLLKQHRETARKTLKVGLRSKS